MSRNFAERTQTHTQKLLAVAPAPLSVTPAESLPRTRSGAGDQSSPGLPYARIAQTNPTSLSAWSRSWFRASRSVFRGAKRRETRLGHQPENAQPNPTVESVRGRCPHLPRNRPNEPTAPKNTGRGNTRIPAENYQTKPIPRSKATAQPSP